MASPTEHYCKHTSVSSLSFYFDLWECGNRIQLVKSEEVINSSDESISVLAHWIGTNVFIIHMGKLRVYE